METGSARLAGGGGEARLRLELVFSPADHRPDPVNAAVVDQGDRTRIDRDSVKPGLADPATAMLRVLDLDLVAGATEAPGDGVTRPGSRDRWVEAEGRAMSGQSEDLLQPGAIHPACRTGVPGPSAPPQMRGVRIDVAGQDVRLRLVPVHVRERQGVIDRDTHVKQLDRIVS